MADPELNENKEVSEDSKKDSIEMEGGTYDIIRERLHECSKELLEKIDKLNSERKEIFGQIETKLVATERIKTNNNCVPRDMVIIGNQMLLGYNVFFGLRKDIQLEDVFSQYELGEDHSLTKKKLSFLEDEKFQREYIDLYKYYKKAKFVKFSRKLGSLLIVFQVGDTARDIKVFKWLIDENEGKLSYQNSHGEEDYRFPLQHDFEWQKTNRDQHVYGKHPHINIGDQIFVECVGGDLTIKVEDNTESGEGIYCEPVEHLDQNLDDASIEYTILDHLILLRIKPYMEEQERYIIYNHKTQKALRCDSISESCLRLPEGHGLIFPKGYYLSSGEYKLFPDEIKEMKFIDKKASPNGEDFIYIFYHEEEGKYVLLQYNLIQNEVFKPFLCHGYAFKNDGLLLLFRADKEPKKLHPLQVWNSTFYGEDFEQVTEVDSFIFKIGNKELVQGIADFYEIIKLIERKEVYFELYQDLLQKVNTTIDSYFWISKEEAGNFLPLLEKIRKIANSAISEYEKFLSIRQNTKEAINAFIEEYNEFFQHLDVKRLKDIPSIVEALSKVRMKRGEALTLKDYQYADLEKIEGIEKELGEWGDRISNHGVSYLLEAESFQPYLEEIQNIENQLTSLEKVSEVKALETDLGKIGESLDLLTQTINNLKIEDPAQTTKIIQSITEVYTKNNQVKAKLDGLAKDLGSEAAVAEFGAQYLLLEQTVSNFIGLCEKVEQCDEYQSKAMLMVEELESRFTDSEELLEKIQIKREEVYEAFSSKKQILTEAQNRKAQSALNSAERIYKGIQNKSSTLEKPEEIRGYFASDSMVLKVREIISTLNDLGQSIKADEWEGKLKMLEEETLRTQKDKKELFEDGDNVIRFGEFRFSVNTQKLDLTALIRNEMFCLHLSGTDYYEDIRTEEIEKYREYWNQELPSETDQISRFEFLAFQVMKEAESDSSLKQAIKDKLLKKEGLRSLVEKFMNNRYDEGYQRGVHDHDAALLIEQAYPLKEKAGLLSYHPRLRALASIFYSSDKESHKELILKANAVGLMESLFEGASQELNYVNELASLMVEFFKQEKVSVELWECQGGAQYLFEELKQVQKLEDFAISKESYEMYQSFIDHLKKKDKLKAFQKNISALKGHIKGAISILLDWGKAFLKESNQGWDESYLYELVALFFRDKLLDEAIVETDLNLVVDNCLSQHEVIKKGRYQNTLEQLLLKLESYSEEKLNGFYEWKKIKNSIIDQRRKELRLEEFEPKIMGSFVRNQLIDQVYLPLVGANFAKQMGEVGAAKRVDLMGLLLLISPPGYGKTTLMEYISSRLGLTFIKINGPAIGHGVTSLDPSESGNATAREEIRKLNLSFEMGNNIMIYLDDIQHLNPEFLQKFISLCDGQRKIEGVYKGAPRTYDFRGKKVVVVMAGNPYTESGEKFQIPDMLANRADTYNLGDVIGGKQEVFELSYLENSITSNSVIQKLVHRSQNDFHKMIDMIKTGQTEGVSFECNYSPEEIKEYLSVLKKLQTVQKIILKVNQAYIYSASQSDDYRREPPFKLQGSYRNMNKITEKILPIMNDEELLGLVRDHYGNESQTLTSDSEFNYLKFLELADILGEEQKLRLKEIREAFQKNQQFKGIDEGDQFGKLIITLDQFGRHVNGIQKVLKEGVTVRGEEGE